jgi:hypothetical protein
MGKEERVIQVIIRWCGKPPANGSDTLRALWETHGPNGVPFEMEGAERLIGELDAEFPGHRLRPVDLLELTFDGLVDAIPDRLVRVAISAPVSAASTARSQGPVLVELTDDSIERLARRLAELLTKKPARGKKR